MNQEVATIPPYEDGIISAKEDFQKLAPANLSYGDEEIFAIQMLTKHPFSLKTANENPRSVQFAMINVASTGLTLNPAMGYAYLVPRDRAIVLDISYKGLIKIATDAGSIKWVRAECVHEQDDFTYYGPAAAPTIQTNPFRDRGPIIGAYCIAKTVDGDILTEVMDLAAILKIRDASTAFTKGAVGSKGPWESYFPEMCRKAVIKRARKTWPYTDQNERLAKAIEISNESEGGYEFEKPQIGRPTDGAWEAMDPETQKALLKLAAKVTDLIESEEDRAKEDKESDAWHAIEKEGLGSEEKIALWTQLGSKIRSALKRAGERQKLVVVADAQA